MDELDDQITIRVQAINTDRSYTYVSYWMPDKGECVRDPETKEDYVVVYRSFFTNPHSHSVVALMVKPYEGE